MATLSQIPVWIARVTPRPVKMAIHRVRFLDRALMGAYGSMIQDKVMTIGAGPMRGVKLAASQHTSHAHINGTYEREVQVAIDSMLRPGDVCYDLGASIGYMTLLMARKAKHVYSFEPAPHAANEMKAHLAANGFQNVTIVPSPVSDGVREVRFCLTDGPYGSPINATETRWPVLQLQTTTLDISRRIIRSRTSSRWTSRGKRVACSMPRRRCSRNARPASAPRCTIGKR